ncbi:MAG: SRPBCC family protein [bacterium]|nr:SRPBCC family protein [bacterium]
MLRNEETTRSLDASRDLLFTILTDYDRYREWLPGIEQSRVLAREGDIVVAEFKASHYGPEMVALEFIHSPPASIAYSQVEHYGKPDIAGRWELSDPDEGTGVGVKAAIRLSTPLFKFRSRRLMRASLEEALAALAKRSAALATGEVAEAPAARRKVLEVLRRPQGLEIWYLGESYMLSQVRRPRR